MGRLYGKVESVEDISRINCLIRDEMLVVNSAAELTDLKKRSDYLCTLTFSPFWKKKFGDKIEEVRDVALKENRATVKTANYVSQYKNFNKTYEPWKKEIDIEEELKKIPDEVVSELTESIFTLQNSVQILEDLRNSFCEIRKAAVLCDNVECLDKLKKAVDILSTLPYLESFKVHFDEGILSAIDALINTEKERSVNLINIIAQVNNWDRFYQSISENDFETTAENYLDKLLEEEEKANTYIPTEMKYKGGARVLWLVYYHPEKKREYAKRIYFPSNAENIKIEGPGEYKNRFGNKVWGIKITYEMEISPTIIHVRGKEIHLPARKVTKTKIVEVPKYAQNIRILEEKPQSAMDIA
ncbi:hypothetical protein NAMH_0673 [Nautilia profundicola AmH]|uniref:Uncharacterized protein n=1 Tax=Nautilia profundicola (strain ATCC BAA-1463 / DSM 18972 / AmH) TaxID=598659 RepID=B9L8X6_NAUPA|nr:hypothetical protein [Nautilia profundicola]ACM93693.1 hypothetical protein NAMH_0673 [Nautilia profundicola AmH]